LAPDGTDDTRQAVDDERRARLRTLRHELRTPVNHILGYSELLLEEAEDAAQDALADRLRQIHDDGNRALVAINDGLDPSKGAIEEIDAALLRQAVAPPLESIVDIGAELQESVQRCGEDDYLPDLQRIDAAARHLLALVQADLSSTADEPKVPGEPGAPGDPAVDDATVGASDEAGAGTCRILVVDDIEANRDVLARRLERLGYAVARAENGRRALEMVHSTGFDLVLLDIMMPVMNGYEALERLKGNPETRDIPVIVISALDELQSVVRCIEMGAEDYLPKPFDPVLLRARIGACLEKKRLRDQEVAYLRDVSRVTGAAAALEATTFEPESLSQVAERPDELGQLARVFGRMALEVRAREQRLRQQVQELRIEIDQTKKARQVAEVTESDYFQQLRSRAGELRKRTRGD
jgi:CheY-like chemotaxis protein